MIKQSKYFEKLSLWKGLKMSGKKNRVYKIFEKYK